MAQFAQFELPPAYNEPLRDYAPGSEDAKRLKETCERLRKECPDIPCFVGGEEVVTHNGNLLPVKQQRICSDHKKVLCTYHEVSESLLDRAVSSALAVKRSWEETPFESRAAIFLKAADLLAGKYRYEVVAATMLGQGKTVWQAEIDAAAETIDFLRINPYFAQSIYRQQPLLNGKGTWNRVEYRPLEGFIVAIAPFNFTAIGANLATAPALMGNVVLWKPASTAVLSNWVVLKALREAGLPNGVIQFIPGSGRLIGERLLNDRDFAGLHFTGSTEVFNALLLKSAEKVSKYPAGGYKSYPRMVGETGGKDFHFAHSSADVDSFVNNTIRASFEYQGQKCSACSRAYIPESMWPAVKTKLQDALENIYKHMGQSDDFRCFMTAVIDKASYDNIKKYVDNVRKPENASLAEIVIGADFEFNDSVGYFCPPIVIQAKVADYETMTQEIFGPVLTVYVYPDDKYEETLELCDKTSPYALTGSIFATDLAAQAKATRILRHSSGNFYINDKSTGAVVAQQPFGGGRMSGTNDKAGSHLNLLRWVSPRTIKEQFLPSNDWRYPHMHM